MHYLKKILCSCTLLAVMLSITHSHLKSSHKYLKAGAATIIPIIATLWAKNSEGLEKISQELGLDKSTLKELAAFGSFAAGFEVLSRTGVQYTNKLQGASLITMLCYLGIKLKTSKYFQWFKTVTGLSHLTDCKNRCGSCSYCKTWDGMITALAAVLSYHGGMYLWHKIRQTI